MTYNAPVWDLTTIIEEFRGIVGVPDQGMLSNQQCADLINWYYQYVLPKELKIFWGYTKYEFFTIPNIDQYLAPKGFQTFNPSVYADGFPIEWYADPDTFYQDWPQQMNKQQVATTDGNINSFSFTISAYPVLRRSVYVTDGTQVTQDDGIGGFVNSATGASVSGSIDYVTGSVVGLSFPVKPSANLNITATSQTYMPNRPQGILFWRQDAYENSTEAVRNAAKMFVIRPVPDQVYKIRLQGIQVPQPLKEDTDVPFRADLGPLIALGAALQRFKRLNQMDQYDQYIPEYNRFKDICMQDTYEELLYERSIPAF